MYRSVWLTGLVLFVAGPVSAAELHWDAPEGCPDVHALEREAEQVLGESLAGYPLNVSGTITQGADQLVLSLRITLPADAETRERSLQAASCQELLEATAVAIALAAADSGDRARAPAVPQSSDATEPPLRAAVPVALTDKSRVAVSALGASSWGSLLRMGLGVELQLAWMRRWLRIGLAVTWFPLRSMQLANNVQASFGMYFVEVLACAQRSFDGAHFFGCATASVGRMEAHLDAPVPVLTESTPWRALSARVGVTYPILPPLELTAALAVVAPLTRPRFYTQPPSHLEVHEPSPVAVQLLLGLLFSL